MNYWQKTIVQLERHCLLEMELASQSKLAHIRGANQDCRWIKFKGYCRRICILAHSCGVGVHQQVGIIYFIYLLPSIPECVVVIEHTSTSSSHSIHSD